MAPQDINILLADDDKDDCMFFQEAIEELQLNPKLTIVYDGEQLMQLLYNQSNETFDVLFLDLNMPRKNGISCLTEIKSEEKLKSIPVIIMSTSHDESIASLLFDNGAQYYICKPTNFSELKRVVHLGLTLALGKDRMQPSKENFLLNSLQTISFDMKTNSSKKNPPAHKVLRRLKILLADDDPTDCLLFKEALDELPVSAQLSIVENGEELIEALAKKSAKLPDVIFLDLNMPRKNGFISLAEIKSNIKLQNLPVIIFTTASELDMVNMVYKDAAHYYICKPADFSQLKKVIYEALTIITQKNNQLPVKDNFIITGDSIKIPDTK